MNIKPELPRPGLFRDRAEAGRLLAAKLTTYVNRPDVIVLGLPRGGVPVAYEVARALGAPLDVFIVRKLGVWLRRTGDGCRRDRWRTRAERSAHQSSKHPKSPD
jgi:Phosphoribosyl transferase domain